MAVKLLAGLLVVSLAFAGCRSGSLYAPSKDGTSGSTPAVNCAGAMMVSSSRGLDPEAVLQCETFSQRVYWLGKQLAPPNVSDLFFASVWTAPDERPIGPDTRLVLVYASDPSRPLGLEITEWERSAWQKFVSQFTGYDPTSVPAQGPINWWQHPCVEEEVLRPANGAEVHLYKAHLVSLIYLYPKTPDEVARCLSEPVGALGAHVYFEKTVIEFSVQNNVSPSGPPPGPTPVLPGSPANPPTTRTYPPLVIHSVNPYNREDVVRFIASSLKPYIRE